MLFLRAKPAAAGVGAPSAAERRGDRRAGEQLFEIGLPLGNLRDARGQAPRRAVALDRRVGGQPMRAQRAGEAVANLARQARQPRRGQLFGSEFQEKFTIHMFWQG